MRDIAMSAMITHKRVTPIVSGFIMIFTFCVHRDRGLRQGCLSYCRKPRCGKSTARFWVVRVRDARLIVGAPVGGIGATPSRATALSVVGKRSAAATAGS